MLCEMNHQRRYLYYLSFFLTLQHLRCQRLLPGSENLSTLASQKEEHI
jgi:hypothetical protein